MSASASANPAPPALAIGGLAPLSSCDWPGNLVATVFCQGCPWACRYCHNAHLIPPGVGAGPPWREVELFLNRRRGLLDGVVFSGGEPTLQAGLADAIHAVRAMGFAVGLHSAGPLPRRLEAVLPLVDWVGFDVKAPFDAYARITGAPGSGEKARASLAVLIASGVAFELRTTVHPALLTPDDLSRLKDDLAAFGAPGPRVQNFRSQGCVDQALLGSAP